MQHFLASPKHGIIVLLRLHHLAYTFLRKTCRLYKLGGKTVENGIIVAKAAKIDKSLFPAEPLTGPKELHPVQVDETEAEISVSVTADTDICTVEVIMPDAGTVKPHGILRERRYHRFTILSDSIYQRLLSRIGARITRVRQNVEEAPFLDKTKGPGRVETTTQQLHRIFIRAARLRLAEHIGNAAENASAESLYYNRTAIAPRLPHHIARIPKNISLQRRRYGKVEQFALRKAFRAGTHDNETPYPIVDFLKN